MVPPAVLQVTTPSKRARGYARLVRTPADVGQQAGRPALPMLHRALNMRPGDAHAKRRVECGRPRRRTGEEALTAGIIIILDMGKDPTSALVRAREATGATREAGIVVLDRCLFRLDARAFKRFAAALDAAPSDNPRLRRLLAKEAPWDL